MGTIPLRDETRDQALVNDYKAGIFKNSELVAKYGVSSTRIYQVLNHYGVELLRKDRKYGKRNKRSKK